MEEVFKHSLCLLSARSQSMANIRKARAGSIEDLAFRMYGMEDLFFQSLERGKLRNLLLKRGSLHLRFKEEPSEPLPQYHQLVNIQYLLDLEDRSFYLQSLQKVLNVLQPPEGDIPDGFKNFFQFDDFG